MAGALMAKKKARSPKNKERQGPGFRTIGIRASDAYAEWLERAAKHNRITVAAFADQAFLRHARETGFDEPPPERIP